MVLGRALDVLAANPVAGVLHPSYRPGHNLALDVFLDEAAQTLYADPEQVRRNRVGTLRAAAGALPGDPRLVDVIGELSIRSSAFRGLWVRHDIHAQSIVLLGSLAAAPQAPARSPNAPRDVLHDRDR